MQRQKTENHVKTPKRNKRYDSSEDSDKISVSELNHSVIGSNCSVPDSNHSVAKKTNDLNQKSMNSLNDDISSDGNISDDNEDLEKNRIQMNYCYHWKHKKMVQIIVNLKKKNQQFRNLMLVWNNQYFSIK